MQFEITACSLWAGTMIAIMGKSPGRTNAVLVEVKNLDLSIKRSLQIDMTNGCQFIVPLVDWGLPPSQQYGTVRMRFW